VKRKIIELGHDCMVLSLPKKWIDLNNLKKGDELDVETDETKLILSSSVKLGKKKIDLNIATQEETAVRMLIIGAYRSGYDEINIVYSGDIHILNRLVDNTMIGFEIISKNNNKFVIGSVAEPDYKNFNNIIEKQFFIIEEMLSNIQSEDIPDMAGKVQKYDNFLKRSISKKVLQTKSDIHLWQFLSLLTKTSRVCYYFNKHIRSHKVKLSAQELKLIAESKELLLSLQKAYLKKDLTLLIEIHHLKSDFVHNRLFSSMKKLNPVNIHFIIQIADTVYYATSPLAGIVEADSSYS